MPFPAMNEKDVLRVSPQNTDRVGYVLALGAFSLTPFSILILTW